MNQNLHFNETPKGFVWTVHAKKCRRRRSLRRRCRLPHLGLWRPVSSISPPHLYSSGASKRQVPVEMRSPETSNLLLPPCSPPDSRLPLHPTAPRATCSGSLQAVLRQAFQSPERIHAPKAPPHPLTRTVNWVPVSGVWKSDRENRTRGSVLWMGWGEFEAIWRFWVHLSPPRERVLGAPFPTAPLSHCRVVGPRSKSICLCLSPRPWAPAQSRSWAEGAFTPLSRIPSSPGAALEAPAPVTSSLGWVSGTGGDRPIPAPCAYLQVPTDGLATDALLLSFSPFPLCASLLPPPGGWAPPPPLPDHSPACSPVALRRGASSARGCEAGCWGWTRRWGADGARREEGMSLWLDRLKPCGELGSGGGEKSGTRVGWPTPLQPRRLRRFWTPWTVRSSDAGFLSGALP